MTRSLARRIFLAMLSIGVINVTVTLVATEVIYEDIEEANLTVALAEERAFFASQINTAVPQSWRTALLRVYYLPQDALHDPEITSQLPAILRERPVPFAAEIEEDDRTFLVAVNTIDSPPGVMYLAQDISIVEDREDLLQEVGFALLVTLMSVVCLLLALAGARYVIHPLKQLTGQIRAISPEKRLQPIHPPYRDRELEEIRTVLNELLSALNTYIQREQGLVSMASHELRTPVAVIAGALDVLEQRNTLGADDRRTVARIRQATDKMQSDVNALLKLARRPANVTTSTDHPDQVLAAVVAELEISNPRFQGRIDYCMTGCPEPVGGDPDLIHMLVRNLLQNALRHTANRVTLRLEGRLLEISDTGGGLPDDARRILTGPEGELRPLESGLGLYIVRLLAARLDCRLEVLTSPLGGTLIRIELREPAENKNKEEPRPEG